MLEFGLHVSDAWCLESNNAKDRRGHDLEKRVNYAVMCPGIITGR